MTSAEARLRETMQRAADVPMEGIDFDQLAQAHLRHVRRRWVAASAATVAITTAVVWAVSAGTASTGNARLIPITAPSTPAASPQVEAITQPIVDAGLGLRLDPAGPPPPSTASYQRLLAADQGRALSGPVRVVYGVLRWDGHTTGSLVLSVTSAAALNNRPAVLIIHRGPTETAYTVVDATTAKPQLSWANGARMPLAQPSSPAPLPSASRPHQGAAGQGKALVYSNLVAFERSGSYGPLIPGERRWAPNERVIPAVGVTPTISARAAEARGPLARDRGGVVYAQLSYLTDDGQTGVGPDGKLSTDPKHRLVVNRLVWLVVYPNATAPAPLHGKMPYFYAVDASTGKLVDSWGASHDLEERAPGAPPD